MTAMRKTIQDFQIYLQLIVKNRKSLKDDAYNLLHTAAEQRSATVASHFSTYCNSIKCLISFHRIFRSLSTAAKPELHLDTLTDEFCGDHCIL